MCAEQMFHCLVDVYERVHEVVDDLSVDSRVVVDRSCDKRECMLITERFWVPRSYKFSHNMFEPRRKPIRNTET